MIESETGKKNAQKFDYHKNSKICLDFRVWYVCEKLGWWEQSQYVV